VAKYLAGKEYKPYEDIPHTAAIDPMEDNLRNRLLMFIGKFSDQYVTNEKTGKPTPSKYQLSAGSLIKWENKNNPKIIGIARKLIFIAHNTINNGSEELTPLKKMGKEEGHNGQKPTDLLQLEEKYNRLWNAIIEAETDLYSTSDRHLQTEKIKDKEKALHEAIESYLNHMPRVFDPFAGGGAIPLEAARLGCRTYGNDINPVAHIIQRGSVEYPQKYGKPIIFTREKFLQQYPVFNKTQTYTKIAEPTLNYGFDQTVEIENYDDAISKHTSIENSKFIHVKNRLAFDVEYYARQMLSGAEKEIGHYYPEVNGKKPIAYYWTRIGTCSNPSCKAEVPLLRQFYLANKSSKKVYFNPIINGTEINFEIKKGETDTEGWITSRSLKCPCCGNSTSIQELKSQSVKTGLKEKLIAVVEESEEGKNYRLPVPKEKNIHVPDNLFDFSNIPVEKMQEIPDLVSGRGWGISRWNQMFSRRQLLAMQTFVNQHNRLIKQWKEENGKLDDYQKGIFTYLAMFVNRMATRLTSFGLWNTSAETLEHPFGRQAIPMVFDYPEANPFSNSTGGGLNQIEWLIRYIIPESWSSFYSISNNAASGEISHFKKKSLYTVITDPPYYDAIAYADLADFFYVWLKRTLGDVFPLNFATPQTPKSEECTALKHHHQNNYKIAKKHFENKLQQIFSSIEQQTSGIVSIMFAHQSTEAWTTLCNSILGANMNITGSWAIDTERSGAGVKSNKAFLSSSVTVSCRPNIQIGYVGFKEIKNKIEARIKKEVGELYTNGFRGADLLTACFGKAVSEFGEYKTVEKADGTPVKVSKMLELARDAAFNAIISDIDTDEVTKFYIGWLNLFGFTQAEHDDVMRITQIGLSVETSGLHHHNIFEISGNKESLSGYRNRCNTNQKLGTHPESYTIDKIHKAMLLYQVGNRSNLVEYLGKVASSVHAAFWRVCTALAEVLPAGCDDHKQLTGLLTNKENLIREAYRSKQQIPEQRKFEM